MKKTLFRWGYPSAYTYDYRRGPVPFTACYGGAGYGLTILRRPRTTQERRDYFRHEDEMREYGFRIRGRRKPRALPNAWDDICRSDIFNHKNWKRHRRTQYKVDKR